MSEDADAIAAEVIARATRDYAGPLDPARLLMRIADALIVEIERLTPGQPHGSEDGENRRVVTLPYSDEDCLHCCLLQAVAEFQATHPEAENAWVILEHMAQAMRDILAPAPAASRAELVGMIAAMLAEPDDATSRPN